MWRLPRILCLQAYITKSRAGGILRKLTLIFGQRDSCLCSFYPRQVIKVVVLRPILEKFFRRYTFPGQFMLGGGRRRSYWCVKACLLLRNRNWMPPNRRDAALETYIKKTRMDVERQLDNLEAKRCKDNLPPEERSALKSLRQRTDLVIKPADKGSAVLVLSKEDYIKEANRQLNESVYNRKLSADPTSAIFNGGETMCGLDVQKRADRENGEELPGP